MLLEDLILPSKMNSRCNSVRWLCRVLLVSTFLAGAVAIPASTGCSINCNTECQPGTPQYQPQRCDNCCVSEDSDVGYQGESNSLSNRLAAVESIVYELRLMTGILLALVVLPMMAFVGLFVYLTIKLPKTFQLPFIFFKKKDNDAKKSPQKICNGVTPNGRLANHQSTSSPPRSRSSITSCSLGNTDSEHPPRPFRVREPSESTCPEEGNDITSPQGYDNLALSTSTIDTSSTLHNTSNSSTDTLGPTLSTSTLHTTLPSEPHPFSSNNPHHNTRVWNGCLGERERKCVGGVGVGFANHGLHLK